MINFTNKFDDKCENWGVFVSADKLLLKTSKLEVEDMVKINKFLKKIQKSKDEKNTPDDADEGTGTHVAKKTKRGLQLAADVNTN